MATLGSTKIPLDTPAPSFRLPDVDGRVVGLDDYAEAPALLVAFICNHCPYVIHLRDALVSFADEYAARGLRTIAISANDASRYPQDAPARMREVAIECGFGFPYLFDEQQHVARSYGAACTPDFFLYDAERRLFYRGQFDGSRPGNRSPVTGADLRAAADALLAGAPAPEHQQPSVGCSIKWRAGNAPDDAG